MRWIKLFCFLSGVGGCVEEQRGVLYTYPDFWSEGLLGFVYWGLLPFIFIKISRSAWKRFCNH